MPSASTGLASMHLDVLYLLVIGAQRHTIARDLYLSTRTVDQRIADLKQTLGTADRFVLGVAAIRRRWIDPVYPVAHASARREGDDWFEPNPRQYEIIQLRANGATNAEIAEKFGVSAICVRRSLLRLAAANGARNAVNAGALFESLGWVRSRPPNPAGDGSHPATTANL